MKRYIKGETAVRDDRKFFVFHTKEGRKVETKALTVEDARKNIEDTLKLKLAG